MEYIFYPTLCSCLPVRNDLFILALGTTEIRGNFLFPKFSETFSISETKCLKALKRVSEQFLGTDKLPKRIT